MLKGLMRRCWGGAVEQGEGLKAEEGEETREKLTRSGSDSIRVGLAKRRKRAVGVDVVADEVTEAG
jgi:hypothetical protein